MALFGPAGVMVIAWLWHVGIGQRGSAAARDGVGWGGVVLCVDGKCIAEVGGRGHEGL